MSNEQKSVNIILTEGQWLGCPTCRQNKHMAKILPETEGENIVFFCRRCKAEHKVNISKGQCFFISQS